MKSENESLAAEARSEIAGQASEIQLLKSKVSALTDALSSVTEILKKIEQERKKENPTISELKLSFTDFFELTTEAPTRSHFLRFMTLRERLPYLLRGVSNSYYSPPSSAKQCLFLLGGPRFSHREPTWLSSIFLAASRADSLEGLVTSSLNLKSFRVRNCAI